MEKTFAGFKVSNWFYGTEAWASKVFVAGHTRFQTGVKNRTELTVSKLFWGEIVKANFPKKFKSQKNCPKTGQISEIGILIEAPRSSKFDNN